MPEEVIMNEWMRRAAMRISAVLGSPWSIAVALVAVGALICWLQLRGYRQEVLWTFASWLTVVTFVMVFILQNAQNRHDRALQLKLDELLRAVEGARTQMVNLQGLSETELEKLEADFKLLREQERREHGALQPKVSQTGAESG
jgi:low affinity Fe/Cu permease